MKIETLSSSCTANQAVEVLLRDGVVIVNNLGQEHIEKAEAELEPLLSATPRGEGNFFGKRTRRTGRLFLKSSACQELATNSVVMKIAESMLGRQCGRIQINLTQAIRIEPGEREQILHRDDELFPVEKFGREFMLNAIWAYSDFTEANGATRLVPGSHREEMGRNPAADRVASAEMERGSVLIYLGSTLHGGGENRTSLPRTGIVMSYSLGWLRQAENQYLAYPPDVARNFSPELQELIGYCIHEPNLGWYEGQDPNVVLQDNVPSLLAARDYVPVEVERQIEEIYSAGTG